jgi:hypothetical protein
MSVSFAALGEFNAENFEEEFSVVAKARKEKKAAEPPKPKFIAPPIPVPQKAQNSTFFKDDGLGKRRTSRRTPVRAPIVQPTITPTTRPNQVVQLVQEATPVVVEELRLKPTELSTPTARQIFSINR